MMSEWKEICKDGLPENEGLFICWGKNLSLEVEKLLYQDDTWFWTHDMDVVTGVTHWQPLPDPPKAN